MNFGESISVCFKKYADFNGRAARPEFWWFFLFSFLIQMVIGVVGLGPAVSGIITLGLLLPSLAVGARRLHDTNRSGWWQLIALIPLIGIVVLIVFWMQDAKAPNTY